MIAKPSDFGGLFSCQRVLIIGANGAGKTWFANRLSDRTGLPVFHNDAFALKTGWAYRDRSDIRRTQDDVIAQPRWILEGGPSLLQTDGLKRADVVVWLDPPKSVRIGRIIWRSIRFMGRNRPEHPEGNADWPGRRQFRFVRKAWRLDAKVRAEIGAALAETSTPTICHQTAKAARDLF